MKLRERLSGKEASGALTLIFVILFIQTVIFLFNVEEPSPDTGKMAEYEVLDVKPVEFKAKVATKRVTSESNSFKRKTPIYNKKATPEVTMELFEFDPNSVTHGELMRLGLTSGQASVVIKFRERGGVFRKKEDLRKIYVLPDGFYERVEEYVRIASEPERVTIVELNSADSMLLLSLPGIGPYYASKILDFRRRTGGFAYTGQLLDIKGIDNEKFNLLKDKISADSNSIVKRELSSVKEGELSRNPYIGSYLARAIVRFVESYKEQPVEVAHLAVNNVINKELLRILLHYFH
ncbi:MAG: ComEA family DNA-binding protein [Bacteroidales bacterium]